MTQESWIHLAISSRLQLQYWSFVLVSLGLSAVRSAIARFRPSLSLTSGLN